VTPAPRGRPAPPPAPEPPEPPSVYFYPAQGQSPERQDRDRYECYNWAVKQTGFDPGRRPIPPQYRAAVVPAPAPGAAVAAGALTGAVLGAVIAGSRDAGEGAVVGAVAGGALGAASAEARAQDAERQASRVDRRRAQAVYARYEREAAEYRRAISACLEGRGYTVR
jgi:hypothetical protein